MTVETRGSCLNVSECLVSECQKCLGGRPTADVEGVVVPNGQGQGLEPPSKPIGCIPNLAVGILGLLCGETCVASRVGRVRSVKVSEFDTIDTR